MSLINEALKRSESDKLRNSSPYFNNLTLMMPEGDEVPPPQRPTFEEPRGPRRPTSRLLIFALVATACFAAWHFWGRSTGRVGPEIASGKATQEQEEEKPLTPAQMKAMVERSAPDPSLNKHNTDSQAGANAGARAGARGGIAGGNARDAFAAAMRKLQQARQDGQSEESADPAEAGPQSASRSDPLTSGGAPIRFRHPTAPQAPQADDIAQPSPAWPPQADGATPPATAPAETGKPPSAQPPAAQPAKPAPAPADVPDASKLRVTAIMRGPDGNVALINGGLYREGQTIQGALIVKIGQYEVELTANGKRFTIRI
jgi:hypothetical protein